MTDEKIINEKATDLNKEVLEQLGIDSENFKQQKANKVTYDTTHNIAFIHFDSGAEPTVVDFEHGQALEGLNLQKHALGYTTISFRDSEGKRRQYYLHRFIKGVHKQSTDVVVDHVDNNPNDNRTHKLRVTTYESNTKNKKIKAKELEFVTKLMIDNELAIKVTNGVYNDFTIVFDDENEWLEHYKWICEVGANVAIPMILQAHKDAGNQLEVIADIEQKKEKLDRLKKRFIQENEGATSGIIYDDNKAYFIVVDSKHAKYEPFRYKQD